MCLLTVQAPENTGLSGGRPCWWMGDAGVGKVTRVSDLECCQSSHGKCQR